VNNASKRSNQLRHLVFTTNMVIRDLARRIEALNDEMAEIDRMLTGLLEQTAPGLLGLHAAGTDTSPTKYLER